ncbi:hypothetical protein DFR52_102869 [Hoeflea marina]|uniref:Uncharacterized protein n=1 Tax=Hoeflea marina TaxID=274592 RepID=A0A317PPI7_9HYPH|nr:winged helix-turn-helix domain-containing protein [Hoeflea marina]PWW02201.1 hypothetical protein DFR52_102869 [Hoeflea marina]
MSALSEVRKIADGDLTPAAALMLVRNALTSAGAAHVYAALRDLVWKKLIGRDFGSELGEWHSALAQTEALLREQMQPSVADKVLVLAELLAASARHAKLHPQDEILQRKHVRAILALLARNDNSAPRSMIARELGLADANLSRVLGIMAMAGLVRRVRNGKEAVYVLEVAGSNAHWQVTHAANKSLHPTAGVHVASAAPAAPPQQSRAVHFAKG